MTKVVSTAATRDAYGKALLELGDRNPEVVVLGGDLNESTRTCLLYTSPSPRDGLLSRMPSSA